MQRSKRRWPFSQRVVAPSTIAQNPRHCPLKQAGVIDWLGNAINDTGLIASDNSGFIAFDCGNKNDQYAARHMKSETSRQPPGAMNMEQRQNDAGIKPGQIEPFF